MSYTNFKANVLGKVIGDGQCVSLIVNNSNAYVENLFPGVSWPNIIAPVNSAYQLAGKSNSYLTWVANDHSDVNQVPPQGAIMVFGPTGPDLPYADKYANPDGHCGICDEADSSGYALCQQNAPAFGQVVNVARYAWDFRPCLGWYIPTTQAPAPTTPAPEGETITLPATTGPWHAYPVGGPYNPNTPGLPELWPSKFGGLTYNIVNNRGNGIYTIQTQDFGERDLWTNGSNVIIK